MEETFKFFIFRCRFYKYETRNTIILVPSKKIAIMCRPTIHWQIAISYLLNDNVTELDQFLQKSDLSHFTSDASNHFAILFTLNEGKRRQGRKTEKDGRTDGRTLVILLVPQLDLSFALILEGDSESRADISPKHRAIWIFIVLRCDFYTQIAVKGSQTFMLEMRKGLFAQVVLCMFL